MFVDKFSFRETGQFSQLFLDYIDKKSSLDRFYNNFPDEAGFKSQIESRQLDKGIRAILADQLNAQYRNPEGIVADNIEALRSEKTFTITTGHQLNIFTGPLYFVYKIITVINACKELHAKYPGYKFVPVYWMASEDHDLEEIQYFHMQGQKYTWETDQTGAVGHMDPSGLKEVLDKIPGDHPIFEKAYLDSRTLADAARFYVNELFGHEGVVVIDGDDKELKGIFSTVAGEELFEGSTAPLVKEQSKYLESLGYKSQISAREINLFFLAPSFRERIIRENGKFEVMNSDINFSNSEMEELIQSDPQKLSPNVILRPLYQELILPNLAYVGGPAEIVYWLQLKPIFDHYKITFPILLPRNFVLYIDHVTYRKIEKTGAEIEDVLLNVSDLLKKIVSQESGEVQFNSEWASIQTLYDKINKELTSIDPTLNQMVDAEKKKVEKSIEKIAKKGNRAILRKHTDLRNQVLSWYNDLHPGGAIQERTLNFLHFQIDDPSFLSMIAEQINPFDLRYHVITNK